MVKLTQNSWLGGQLDPEMAGRQDVTRYKIGATTIKNLLPTRRGSLRKRAGTDFVADLTERLSGKGEFRVIPFRFTTSVGYALVLTDCDGWIYGSDGTAKQVNGSIPYKADELKEIGYVQCGDVLYLAHRNHPPAEIDHGGGGSEAGYTAWEYDATQLWKEKPGNAQSVSNINPRVVYDSAKNKWYLTYSFVLTTYTNTTKTAVKASAFYSVVYSTSAETDARDATSLTFATYSYTWGSTTKSAKASVKATRSAIAGATSSSEDFYYKVLATGVQVQEPVVADVEMRRLGLAAAYRGGIMEVKYAATLVEEIDGVEYESQIGEGVKIDGYTNESFTIYTTSDSFGVKDKDYCSYPDAVSRGEWFSTTTFYAPWTESQVMTITVSGFASAPRHITEVRLYKHNGTCYGVIASDTTDRNLSTGDSFNVEFQDDNITPDTSMTPFDEKEVFQDEGNYPACVALYQQRLVWASSKNSPARIWMSAAGDFHEHRPHQSMQLSDPIDFVMPLTDGTAINFIVELGKLFAFADASEYLIGSDSSTSGVTYETIQTTRQSGVGCAKWLPPIVVNNSLIFCERSGRSVRSYNYDIQQNLYGGEDISVFSSGIFDEKKIVDWAYQQSPESVLWCVLDDGTLASLTYMKDQEVCAWATHEVGGGGKVRGIAATGAIIGNAGSNTTTMEVLVVVERGGKWTLEQMRPWAKSADTARNLIAMDCVKDGDHTGEGLTYVAEAGVSGYPFESVMTTMQPVIGDQVGNAQFDIKNAHHAHLRLKASVGGRVRAASADEAMSAPLRTTTLPEAGADGLMRFGTTDESVVLGGVNSRDGRVTVEQDEPWPFQILLLEQDFEVEEGDNE